MDDKTIENRVRQFLETGRKIDAIKFVRENSELDLKAAKEYVERLMPKTAARQKTNVGVGFVIVVLLLILLAVLASRFI